MGSQKNSTLESKVVQKNYSQEAIKVSPLGQKLFGTPPPEHRVAKYTDEKIAELISERKPLPSDWVSKTHLKEHGKSKSRDFEIEGENGTKFKVILRQSKFSKNGFSVVLAFQPKGTNIVFRLKRYDGKDHAHTNNLEKETFKFVYHIHTATERYQDNGEVEDKYAQITDRYSNIQEAFECMLEDCNFVKPDIQQLTLWLDVAL